MNRLDEDLRFALQREEPSSDFTERVLARLAATPAPTKKRISRWPSWRAFFAWPQLRWMTTGALACGLLVGGYQYHRYQQLRAEGESAKAQLKLALHIASAKLNAAQKKVRESSEPATESESSTR